MSGSLVAGGLVHLASLPTMQWLVLPSRLERAWSWIPTNMGVWAVGTLWTLAPSPFVDERTPIGTVTCIYVGAGLLIAMTVAVLTEFPAWHVIHENKARRLQKAVDSCQVMI
jgi:hypothetical protein